VQESRLNTKIRTKREIIGKTADNRPIPIIGASLMLMFLEVFIFLPLIIGITDDQVLLP